ncbi:hypothetical protein V5O48_012966 [Marasmius crinis-equi]|uniref:Uncharacterized protein n=1 Tax=Marasmius crinis-equi TaxID=585013 RepID=A0ABR3F1K0_9AGAR
MTLSLIFPELIAAWAIQQRKEAGTVVSKYKRYGWTKAHTYLDIMGGLALYDKNGHFRGHLNDSDSFKQEDYALAIEIEQSLRGKSYPVVVAAEASSSHAAEDPSEKLHPKEEGLTPKPPIMEPYSCLLEYMLSRGLVDLSEAEIKANLSHGDAFAKLSALLSTEWFLVQVIARGVQGLVITELEVVTLSFTVLNIAAYVTWWDKPQRVRFPVRVTWEPRLLTPSEAANSVLIRQFRLGWAPRLWWELRCRLVADFNSVVFKDVAARKRHRITWSLSTIGLYPVIFTSFLT